MSMIAEFFGITKESQEIFKETKNTETTKQEEKTEKPEKEEKKEKKENSSNKTTTSSKKNTTTSTSNKNNASSSNKNNSSSSSPTSNEPALTDTYMRTVLGGGEKEYFKDYGIIYASRNYNDIVNYFKTYVFCGETYFGLNDYDCGGYASDNLIDGTKVWYIYVE